MKPKLSKLLGKGKVLLKYLLTVGVPVLSLLLCFAVWVYVADEGWFYIYRLRDLEERFEEVESYLENRKEEVLGLEESDFQRNLVHQELSPNGGNLILMYEMPDHPGLSSDYYNYLSGQYFITVKETDSGRERFVFVGDYKSGYPHWLGNDFIYFTAGCGTACKGLYLVDTRDKETWLAVWGYLLSEEEDIWETHFTDWFDQKFSFDGLVDELKSETFGDEVYLIFKMKDDQGNFLYDKRFLFTEDGLVPQL